MSIPSGWLGPKYEVIEFTTGQMKPARDSGRETTDGADAAAVGAAAAASTPGCGRRLGAGRGTTFPPGTRIVPPSWSRFGLLARPFAGNEMISAVLALYWLAMSESVSPTFT